MGCYKRCHLVDWAKDVSDLHGLKHIVGDGGALRRLIWAAVTLAALVYFIYLCVVSMIDFFQFHHVTKVDINYADELDFPAVTICNFNKYRIIDEDHNLINPTLHTEEFRQMLDAVNWTQQAIEEDYDMTEFTNRTGHQLDEMIVECSWKGEECSSEDFHHVFSHLGNCYTFNHVNLPDERHATISAGAANGLKLTLNIEEEEYTPSNDLDGAAEDAGIKRMLLHPSEPPYVKELGYGAGPGHHTFVAARYEEITSLPSPYTLCEEDGSLQYYDHYSLTACRIECETDFVVEQCGCRLVEQPGTATVCNPAETHECAHTALHDAVVGNVENSCDCKAPCETEVYPFTSTNVKLRANFMEVIYSNTTHNFTAEYIENNFVLLSIYFEALNHEVIEQLPEKTVATLLATLGGNFGLFLGGSALTIGQLLEYLFDESTASCACNTKSNRVRDSCANLTSKRKGRGKDRRRRIDYRYWKRWLKGWVDVEKNEGLVNLPLY